MTIATIAGMTAVGLAIGFVSGMLGIGGGVLIIPALMFLFGYSQPQAIGTSLGMLLPPIGIFAFLAYWKAGNVRIEASAILAITFALGAWGGAALVMSGTIPEKIVRTIFAVFLIYIACNLVFRSEPRMRAAVETMVIIVGLAVVHAIVSLFGRRWQSKLDGAAIYAKRVARKEHNDFEI